MSEKNESGVVIDLAAATKSNIDGGSQEVEALLEAVGLITRLSVMSTERYAKTFAKPSDDGDGDHAASLQSRLDKIQEMWRLEETDLPRLMQSIHRWQSQTIALQADSERFSEENRCLQSQVSESTARAAKLEAALQKLHRKNQKLKEKLKTAKQTQRMSVLKSVKSFLRQEKRLDLAKEQRIMDQLQHHERIMRLEATLRQEGAGNRSRSSSRETTFSDIDCAFTNPQYDTDFEDCYSQASSSVSISSASTVTDEGIATLSVGPHASEEWKYGNDDLELIFPPGHKIGLQFVKVPLERQKKGVLDEMSQEKKANHSPGKESSFSMNPPFHVSFKNQLRIGRKDGFGFLVCGLNGFDETLNRSPDFGSQLIAINGDSNFDEHLSLPQTLSPGKATIRLTFRKHSLSSKQSSLLARATELAELQRPSGNTTSLEVIDVPRESPSLHPPSLPTPTLPKLSAFNPFQHEGGRPQGTPRSFNPFSDRGNGAFPNTPTTTVPEEPQEETATATPKHLGAATTEKLGNAMKAMGSQFKSLF